jgi:hypothetical protein
VEFQEESVEITKEIIDKTINILLDIIPLISTSKTVINSNFIFYFKYFFDENISFSYYINPHFKQLLANELAVLEVLGFNFYISFHFVSIISLLLFLLFSFGLNGFTFRFTFSQTGVEVVKFEVFSSGFEGTTELYLYGRNFLWVEVFFF